MALRCLHLPTTNSLLWSGLLSVSPRLDPKPGKSWGHPTHSNAPVRMWVFHCKASCISTATKTCKHFNIIQFFGLLQWISKTHREKALSIHRAFIHSGRLVTLRPEFLSTLLPNKKPNHALPSHETKPESFWEQNALISYDVMVLGRSKNTRKKN